MSDYSVSQLWSNCCTPRLAEGHLWVETLNLGACDVLAKPFDAAELEPVLNSAWLDWRHEDATGPAQVRAAGR